MATLKTPPPATQGYWTVEKRHDGSYGVYGPDPQDGKPVLVAPFETEEDARHVVHLHNARLYGIQGVADNMPALRNAFNELDSNGTNEQPNSL